MIPNITCAFPHEESKRILCRMPKDLREYRIINDEKVEILYWVANLYGRHDAGRKFVTGHRQRFLERAVGSSRQRRSHASSSERAPKVQPSFANTWMTVHGW